ncbi:tripartite motif-containing protein 14 isoform X2 [Antennarius striatus]|uniref:tripartite motif-containing protein 14 isoform X2 n=1 Tax=Antennarius striatus TaxID=241820 RepID=UPI0035ADB9F1
MSEKDASCAGGQSPRASLSTPAGSHNALQDALSLLSLDSRAVQPFPRSPKLQRRLAAPPSQEQLCRRLEELLAERSRTDAHIQSLKKRKADLSTSSEVMKQQVLERFEDMRRVLMQDQQAVLDSLELDLRRTRTRLDQVQRSWEQHQDQVAKNISSTQRALSRSPAEEEDDEEELQGPQLQGPQLQGPQLQGPQGPSEAVSPRRADVSEQDIRLDEEGVQLLLQTLGGVSTRLSAELQRKTLLLDWCPVLIDRQTCHSQMAVTSEGRGLSYTGSAGAAPEHPLQFDKVCCALGRPPVAAARRYWEVDVRCCAAWAVGVAYASLQRKGRDKGAKLGRNRKSWCVELREGRLSAWHNNRHVACQGVGRAPPGRIGVWVNYDRGQLTFYDAVTMAVLQRFSAAVTPVFDRVHHQFTEPLYPALRLLTPPHHQVWPNHLELCHLAP